MWFYTPTGHGAPAAFRRGSCHAEGLKRVNSRPNRQLRESLPCPETGHGLRFSVLGWRLKTLQPLS